MSEAKLCKSHGKWVAVFGKVSKVFETMKEAAQWIEECAEKEREDGEFN